MRGWIRYRWPIEDETGVARADCEPNLVVRRLSEVEACLRVTTCMAGIPRQHSR